jgi:hypothetical protein
MDKLENLKDVWKNQAVTGLNYTKEDIHNMVKKKSTSIVKWILIISIIEFLLPYVLILFTDLETPSRIYAEYGLGDLTRNYTIVHVIIILGFIYVFYRNYRNISADSSVKDLLRDILKTRKTVKYYIYYNLLMMGILGLHFFYIIMNSEMFISKLPENANITVLWVTAILLWGLFILLVWCFYRIIYGIFLKKLQRNYGELRKRE